jgi:hypothetical protein
MASPKKQQNTEKTVDMDLVVNALAKAVCDGDMVNFRTLFAPFSPARSSSSQSFDMRKYEYLTPSEEQESTPEFAAALELVKRPGLLDEIKVELEANRPPRLPWDLVITLGDNAVRLGKYSIAAQAYELLRVRARIQREFFTQADAALDAGDIPTGVRGYLIGTELAYDYAAFPEPLPMTPDFQTRALVLHAEYPNRPEDCLGLKEPKALMQIALSYLLLDPEAAARLDDRSMDVKLAFLKELVLQRDPEWNVFISRFRDACEAMDALSKRLRQMYAESSLAEEINAHLITQVGEDSPIRIPEILLGSSIEDGEWWQYLKELAHKHPASALLVARQAIGEIEILVPRYAVDSPVSRALGL